MGTKSISFQNWGVLRYGYCSLVLYALTRNPVLLWNTHSKDGIRELTMYKTRKDSQGQGWGAFLRRSFNCSPQMGKEGIHTVLPPANYIQAFSFPPMSTQWKEWICFKEQYIILHSFQFVSTAKYSVPLYMDLQLRKEMKERMKWEGKRTENCLSHPSPSLYVAYLLPIIGSFNVARGLRWWLNV